MASDLSSVCTDDIEIFDEKEEGEISLEDVSSSEESHPNYRLGFRSASGRCTNCAALQQCSPWCNYARIARRKFHLRQDADHGKENRRSANETSGAIGKHSVSTLQEKNDDEDLVPISSDSDMEILGLPSNSIHVACRASPKSSKVRKKRKKKRNHSSTVARPDDGLESLIESYDPSEESILKAPRGSSRSHRRESTSPRFAVTSALPLDKKVLRSPSRRYRVSTRGTKAHSPLRRMRSPVLNHANSTARKISRRLRSSRRDSSRSPVRFGVSRESRDSPTSPTRVDIYASKLLKKVRRLESLGIFSPASKSSRSKEHSSLKEKLNNMMKSEECVAARVDKKKMSVGRSSDASGERENNNVPQREHQEIDGCKNDEEDDDIELLRLAALETKQKRSENRNEKTTPEQSTTRVEVNLSDDNDSEALELRMIALHSAVMNKHRNRVERGLGSKKRRLQAKARNESPFGHSFLDAIPIPDELSDTSGQSPISKSPARNDETNNPEDMELDTDVEREKDSMPYSPTDDLTIGKINDDDEATVAQSQNVLNNETIGRTDSIEKSIRSDLTRNSAKYGPDSTNPKISIQENSGANKNEKSQSSSRYASAESLAEYMENPDAPYSPSKPVEASKINLAPSSPAKSVSNVETPYSPTDAPIYDPELTRFSPDTNLHPSKDTSGASGANKNTNENSDCETTGSKVSSNLVPMMLNMSMNDNETLGAVASTGPTTQNEYPNAVPDFYSNDAESVQFYESIIDELPEIDLDGSPLVPVTKESSNLDFCISLSAIPDPRTCSEPFYLRGLPDITRDANKIPTVVDKTLVPATILKTNKQLQQPMPPKKFETVVEPSFKSAEMRPVNDIETSALRATKTFKPIKLCPLPKKPQVITTNVAAFNSSFGDDTTLEEPTEDNAGYPGLEANKESATSSMTSLPQITLRKSTDLADSSDKVGKSSSGKMTSSERRCGSTSPIRSRNKDKIKAKSVEKYSGDKSTDRAKPSGHPVARRASSSPTVRDRTSDRRISSDKISENRLASRKDRDKTARRASLESGSETNPSKTPRKRKTRSARRKLRSRGEVIESDLGDSNAEKSTNRSIELIADLTAERGKSIGPEVKKSQGNIVAHKGETSTSGVSSVETKLSDNKEKSVELEKKRRCSLDEDEEALRALLLASLPKRMKAAEIATPEPTNSNVRVTRLSDPTTDTSVENTAEKAAKADDDSPLFVTPRPLMLSSQSSSAASSATSNKVPDAPSTCTASVTIAKKILTDDTDVLSSNSSVASSPLASRKRASSLVIKNPPKKIVKKILPALASTRVVNNAKKYQNAMLQKRLNLQRAATTYNATTGSRNITLNNLKSYENSRPLSPKLTNTVSKTQRLVINLESDTDSENEAQVTSNRETSRNETTKTSRNETLMAEARKPLAIPTTDFEESVVQFLKDQRKKIESIAVTTSATTSNVTTTATKSPLPSSSTAKDIGMYSTPLAVRRHLPVSQQEEYRRLKQQIMERERQIQKTIDNGASSPLSPASPVVGTPVSKAQASRPAPQTIATDVATSGEKPQEKLDNLTGTSNVGKMAKAVTGENCGSSISKVAVPPKVVPRLENVTKKPAVTSTPKGPVRIAQSVTIPKVSSSNGVMLKSNGQPRTTNNAVPMTMNVESVGWSAKISSVSSRPNGASLSNVPIIRKSNVPSSSSLSSVTSAGIGSGNSSGVLRTAQTLTIQIPNDKIQSDRLPVAATTARHKNDEFTESSNSPKSLGALRILTKEQLNDRCMKIQVERSSGGRRVTVGTSKCLRNPSSTTNEPPASGALCKCSDDRSAQKVFCDSILSLNEPHDAKRLTAPSSDSPRDQSEISVNGSDVSTLVLSGNENITANNSSASTLVLSRDNTQFREHLESTILCTGGEVDSTKNNKHKNQTKEIWEKIRSDIKEELKMLGTLPKSEQEKLLLENQENLVAKRNMVLEDLTEMTRYLRQLEFEREIHAKLVAEVRRLREQLKSAEDRLNEQQRQMNEMAPRVTREKIKHGRRECYRMSKICQGLGNQVVGPNYKVPVTNARLLNEQLKEMAAYTRQLSKKKGSPLNDELDNTRDLLSPVIASIESQPENSTGSLSEILNLDTPSTSTSEADNNDDTYEDNGPTNESGAPIDETDEPTNVPKIGNEETKDSSSMCPLVQSEKNENTESVETINGSSKNESSCLSNVDESISVLEIPKVSETIAPSGETECPSPMEISCPSDETEVARSPETSASTCAVDISNSSETNVPSKETEASTHTEVVEAAKETELASTNSIGPVTKALTTQNFFLDTVEHDEPASIAGTSTGTNFVPIFPDRALGDNSSTVVGRRSEPLTLSRSRDTLTSVRKNRDRYTSVLTHFRTLRNANPNGILCPYELMGTCNDGDCQYYHFDPERQCQ